MLMYYRYFVFCFKLCSTGISGNYNKLYCNREKEAIGLLPKNIITLLYVTLLTCVF